ncbi:hypothetical protein JCGZ_03119 [Jatropha curcas]|uniref:Uncharacterized protein n=1 Tax=Jatropha curcas TaxID=180498 RepID=A0A067JDK6_JATCU|nr:hypothetical protein JCGZ_03119 [Jatropha curcas]
MNWADFVLQWLVKSVQRFKEAIRKYMRASGIGGCVLFLQVRSCILLVYVLSFILNFIILCHHIFYLDHLDLNMPIKWDIYSWVCARERSDIRCAIASDKHKGGGFGCGEIMVVPNNKNLNHPNSTNGTAEAAIESQAVGTNEAISSFD